MLGIVKLRSERMRRLSKEALWIAFGQGMAVLGALVGVRILTELLTPVAYGELALGMTLATLVNQTVLGPLGGGIGRFYAPAIEREDLRGYLNAVRILILSATGFVFLIILIAIVGLFVSGRNEWIPITVAALLFALLSGHSFVLSSIQNSARQRSIVAFHQGIEAWLRFLVAAILLLWLGASSTIAMVGYVMAVSLVLGSQYVFFRKIIPENSTGREEKYWRKQIWKFSFPISIFGVFTWVQLASDRWALELFSTTHSVGLYAVLFQLGYYPISIANGIATQFLAPIFYQRAGDASDRERNSNVSTLSWRVTSLILGGTVVVFLVAFLFHAQIFKVLAAAEYGSVSYLLPWMILAGGVFSAGQTVALNLMSQMKTHAMIAPKIITALLGVTLNLAGAYWYGTKGIVFAGVLFSILFFTSMVVLSKRNE